MTQTRVLALFGQPVAHSLSPIIFNTVFQKLGEDNTYVPFEVGGADLERAVQAARTLQFSGFNVTMPYKVAIIEFLDALDETAKEIGAVNTVSLATEGLVGHNTDGEGAELAIESYSVRPSDQRVLLVGAGGSARAIVHRLSKNGTQIMILNRDPAKAKKVAEETGSGNVSFDRLTKTTLENDLRKADLLVNATPVQTSALLDHLEISLDCLNDLRWIFDLAYSAPASLALPRIGRISALEMLLQQAGLSYKLWFNKEAPLDLMRSVLVNHLGEGWR